jgi:hypothetical protein
MFDYEDIVAVNNPDALTEPLLEVSTTDKVENSHF